MELVNDGIRFLLLKGHMGCSEEWSVGEPGRPVRGPVLVARPGQETEKVARSG